MKVTATVLFFFVALLSSADTIPVTSTKTLNLAATADAMTVGPDGNLWILDSQHNAVGQMSASGAYVSFPIPTPRAQPWAITTGADGNLWFSEFLSPGKIARITPAGVITEFPLPPTMLGFPWLIAATPDGSIWFLEYGATTSAHNLDRVGRLDRKGNFTEMQVKNAVKLDAIAPAIDGVWIFDDDPSANLLYRMKADGTISYSKSMPSTTYTGGSSGLTAFDGSFWFIHNTGLDRVNGDGSITEYHIPWNNASPAGIALGGDGNIWFTDYNSGQIGELIVSTATPGGQATIIGSDPVGTKIAEIRFLPPALAGIASAAQRRAESGGGDPCPAPAAVIRRDVSTPDNLLLSTLKGPLSCADLQAFITGSALSRAYLALIAQANASLGVGFEILNAGPAPSSDATATIAVPLAVPPPILPAMTCVNAISPTATCDYAPGTSLISCKIPPLNPGGSCFSSTPTIYNLTPDELDEIIAQVNVASGVWDEDISNNTASTAPGAVSALPPPAQAVVPPPASRGAKH